jgi:hypothetical protein
MKCFTFVLALTSLLFLPQMLQAQQIPRAIIRGQVLDDSTRAPLPLANVFISNSTIGTAANVDGSFELKGVPLGPQQIVASIVGYQPGVVSLLLTDSVSRTIEIRLKGRPIQMPAVEVQARDPVEWRKHLERFVKAFFGSTPNSSKCKILNPEVLDFGEEDEPFVATAREALEIENKALGYRFRCVLIHFSVSAQTFQFMGLTAFQPLEPRDQSQAEQWKANRRSAYYGSRRHFLTALFKKTAKQEGFEVTSVRYEWIQRALEKQVGFAISPDSLTTPGELPFQAKLSFPDLLQVVYPCNQEQRPSLIELTRFSVVIYPNGLTLDPLAIWTYGYWSSQRAAEMLPIDYEPD